MEYSTTIIQIGEDDIKKGGFSRDGFMDMTLYFGDSICFL
jgi:hypothetical protein